MAVGRPRVQSHAPRWVALSLAATLLLGSATQAARADEDDEALEQRRDLLATQTEDQKVAIDGHAALLQQATERVSDAEAAVVQAQSDVEAAAGVLAAAQAEVAKAQEVDRQKAQELADAEAELAEAKASQARGEAELEDERLQLAQVVSVNFQQSNTLISIATVLNPLSGSADLSNRIQWAETSLNSSQASIERLEEIQRQLIAARDATAVAQARADDARVAAAAQLRQTEQAEAMAQSALLASQAAEAALEVALAEQQAARDAAATELADAEAKLAQLEAEQAEVNAEIQRRAEEAARKAEEERKAQEALAAQQAAAAAAAGTATSSYGLIRPIPASESWISSPFAYRINPIGGYSEMHDGTDFAANCWTPLRSVAAGTVIKSYFGDGYGYRVFVEHGYVAGHYMISAYNHMVQAGLPVGTYVNQGDIVGYVGTTGYSTGCHLHFHLWVDGNIVDPMLYLP
jgi:murein DD-endopeptidase MepM/ murein hydrolase activator NlpD